MRAPTNLLQHLAEAVLDSNITVMPEGGLPALRQNWADFEAQSRNRTIDHRAGMVVVKDTLAAVLGLVSPGRHVLVLEPLAPQVIDVVRRVGGMARSVAMRPTEWGVRRSDFAQRMGRRPILSLWPIPILYRTTPPRRGSVGRSSMPWHKRIVWSWWMNPHGTVWLRVKHRKRPGFFPRLAIGVSGWMYLLLRCLRRPQRPRASQGIRI